MAELQVKVVVDRSGYDSSVSKINSELKQLSSTPIKLRFEAVGVDNVTASAIKLANAQARIATAQAKAAAEIAKTGRAHQDLAMQQEKTAQSANRLAAAQEKTKQAASGVAREQERTAQTANKLAAQQQKAAQSSQQAAQAAARAESAYSRLGVTMSNFVKVKAFQAITSGISNSISEMKKLDAELVTVRKVADATDAQLAKLSEDSYKIGAKYGRTPSDYAAGVAEFNRAGYRETAESLAELSIKSQLVGDMSATVANQFLLATDAAYQYNGSVTELSAVLDGMNAIDNNYATSIEKIAAGLGKVAPIASQAHVGIDELSAALGTITAVTQRSGEEAATALRALFLNIMGDTKTEIEDGATWTAGEIEGLRNLMKRYIPEIVAEADRLGEVINPMEAIGALAKAYSEGILTEQALVQQVSDIGGKLRSSQLLAIVQNWDMYSSMLNTYKTAAGSADAEVSKMMDSWDAKAKRLETSFTKLMSNFVNGEVAKGGLDALRFVVEALDTDFSRAVISAAALAAGIAGVHKAATGLGGVFNALKSTAGGWATIAIVAAGALVGVIDQIVVDYDELVDKAEAAQKTYQEEQDKLEAVNKELQTTNDRIAELQGKGSLTFVEQQELDKLKAASAELKIQQEYREDAAREAQKNAAYSAAEVIETYAGYGTEGLEEYRGSHLAEAILQERDANAWIVSLEKINQLYHDGSYDVQEYTDAIDSVTSEAKTSLQELNAFVTEHQAYYDRIKDQATGLTSDDLNFVAQYEKAQVLIQQLTATFMPETFSNNQLSSMEKAQAFADSYYQSLEKGSDALLNYEAAYDEMSGRLGDVYGFDTAIALAEELGRKYNLTREAVNALIQDIRIADTMSGDGENWAFVDQSVQDGTASESSVAPPTVAEETSKYALLSDAISKTTTKYLSLKQAMAEMNDTGRISARTLSELEYFGIDLGNVLKDDLAGGFLVSKDAIREAGEDTAELLNELTGSDYVFEDVTEQVDEFAKSLDDAESALSELQSALKDMGESGDLFRGYQDSYAQVMQLFAEGRTGTNAFAMLSRNLLNDEMIAEIGNDAQKMGEFLGSELIAGILDGEKDANELAQFMADNFDGLGAVFEDVGDGIQASITDWDAFSQSVGLSVDVLKGMFGFLDESSMQMKDIGDEAGEAAAQVDNLAASAQNADGTQVSIEADVETAQNEMDETADKAENLEADHDISFSASTSGAETAIRALQTAVDGVSGTHTITFKVQTLGGLPSRKYASGTDNAEGGPSLVNEAGPELIVSKGRAFVAGDGRPTIVDLDAGDIVYTHAETEQILKGRDIGSGIASHRVGLNNQNMSQWEPSTGSGKPPLQSVTVSKPPATAQSSGSNSGGGGGGGGGSSTAAAAEPQEETDWWRIVENHYSSLLDGRNREIDKLRYQAQLLENDLDDLTRPLEIQITSLERLNDQIDRQIELLEREREKAVKPIQDQVDALKEAREEQEAQVTLEEKQKAIEEARAALQNAQNERNIRYYNAEKGQWEWMADQRAVADAEEALKNAEKDLEDFKYEQQIRELEKQIEDIDASYAEQTEALEQNRLANEDRIYELEQQILKAEIAYEEAVRPLEDKIRELERALAAIEQMWADAEVPYNPPEGELSEALANIGGTDPERQAVLAVFEALRAKNAVPVRPNALGTIGGGSATGGMASLLGNGLMFGVAAVKDGTNAYTKNSIVTNDNSGAIYIGSVRVSGDPNTMTIADLISEAGIYVQR